jgi:preprotein translocase subunit SecD
VRIDVRNRLLVVIFAVIVGIVFLLPTIAPDTFKGGWISKPLALGLDLRGGAHLVYEVEAREAVKSRLQSEATALRAKLRDEKIAVVRAAGNDRNQVVITLASNRRTEDAKRIIEQYNRALLPVSTTADGERDVLTYAVSDVEALKIEEEAVVRAIEVLRFRVDQFGVAEPLIQRSGTRRILLQMPGVQNIDEVKRLVGRVGRLEFRLVSRDREAGNNSIEVKQLEGGTIVVENEVMMAGDSVASASSHFNNGQMEVILDFTAEGGRTFRRITQDNVGRQFAIILDGVSYSAPVIQERISGGSARITGSFSEKEASQLSTVLKSGALPATLSVAEERVVGPSLGRESIEKGILACIVGVGAILLLMMVYYKKSGVMASATLVLNAFLLVAMLAGFGATLTLPGLAALALTIGMAVDSNVIIFERIRDELRRGATRDGAVTAGFDRAYTAIVDSNTTTLLAAVVLYMLGSGAIRGFAVALSLGVLTTIFCAVFVARLGFDLFPLRSNKEQISI